MNWWHSNIFSYGWSSVWMESSKSKIAHFSFKTHLNRNLAKSRGNSLERFGAWSRASVTQTPRKLRIQASVALPPNAAIARASRAIRKRVFVSLQTLSALPRAPQFIGLFAQRKSSLIGEPSTGTTNEVAASLPTWRLCRPFGAPKI